MNRQSNIRFNYDFDTINDVRRNTVVSRNDTSSVQFIEEGFKNGCPVPDKTKPILYNYKKAYDCENDDNYSSMYSKKSRSCNCFMGRIDTLDTKINENIYDMLSIIESIRRKISGKEKHRRIKLLNDYLDRIVQKGDMIKRNLSDILYKNELMNDSNGTSFKQFKDNLENVYFLIVMICGIMEKTISLLKSIDERFRPVRRKLQKNIDLFVNSYRHISPIVESAFYCNQCDVKITNLNRPRDQIRIQY